MGEYPSEVDQAGHPKPGNRLSGPSFSSTLDRKLSSAIGRNSDGEDGVGTFLSTIS